MPEDFQRDNSMPKTVNNEFAESLDKKLFGEHQNKGINSSADQQSTNLNGKGKNLSPSSDFLYDIQLDDNILEKMLRKYLGENSENSAWTIKSSPISGRGVFATRDLQPGDLVFRDTPLVLGPRTGVSSSPVCVGCHKGDSSILRGCSLGCGLPVCSTSCESVSNHISECQFLQRSGRSDWSTKLLKAVTSIRCLLLPEEKKKLLLCLQAHHHPQHGFEVEYLRNEVELTPADERFLVQACCVLDANAFETLTSCGSSLRGLYPLAALMNHQCTPNTYYGYDDNNRMVMRAAVHIPEGTEMTDSYMPLLWATLARRSRLEATKHFLCCCPRCADPREMGACLGALKCARENCTGVLLSLDPLKVSSRWSCEECGVMMPARQVIIVQKTLSGLLRILETKDPYQIRSMLHKNNEVLSSFNQVVVELKSNLVWLYGHCHGHDWKDLPDEILTYKESLCRELLDLIQILGAGQCRLRGLYLYEMHCTLAEKACREGTELTLEAVGAIDEAARIFQDDVTAPRDVWSRLEQVNKPSLKTNP